MQNLMGLGLALLLEADTRLNRGLRVVFFIPVLMSALAVGYIFQALLKPDGGLNQLLGDVTGTHVSIAWLGNTTWTIVVVAFVNSWKWMGLAMVIYLAGLKSIPEDLMEAATVDGAGPWRAFRSIRLPLLAPAITFNVATALLGSLNGFDTIQATTQGGPAQTTEVVDIFIFRIFGYGLFAQATAMSLVLFLLVTVLAFGDRLPASSGACAVKTSAIRYVRPVFAVVLAVVVIGIPLWLALVTSAKSQGEANLPDLSLPHSWHLGDNYRQAFEQGHMIKALAGSLFVMVRAVVGVLICGSLASWVLARRTGRLTALLYSAGISGIVLPPAVVTIVLLLRQLGLAGTAGGMIFVYMGMYMSVVIFFITGFVRTIPIDLEEAARIDGARPFTVFVRMILPLLRPVIAIATILVCLYVWNDIFYSFFVLGGGSVTTLPLNLYSVASNNLYQNNWNLIFAYVIMMSLPLLIVFAVAQRRIISGITGGAVK
jgi:raffinose/stachyose/melibiose transport system permease protein